LELVVVLSRYRVLVILGPLVVLSWPLLAIVGPRDWEYVSLGYILGTMIGQTTLAAAWTALGPLPLRWRLPLAAGWLVALVIAFGANIARHAPNESGLVLVGAAQMYAGIDRSIAAAGLVKAAVRDGVVDERAAVLEIMTSLKRAGADFIVTYWALELMEWLKE